METGESGLSWSRTPLLVDAVTTPYGSNDRHSNSTYTSVQKIRVSQFVYKLKISKKFIYEYFSVAKKQTGIIISVQHQNSLLSPSVETVKDINT